MGKNLGPVDWGYELRSPPKQESPLRDELREAASRYCQCALGEAYLDFGVDGDPESAPDPTLRHLAVEFYSAVFFYNWEKARQVRRRIREMLKRRKTK